MRPRAGAKARKVFGVRKELIVNDFDLSDLQAEVAYQLQKPLVRVQGIDFDRVEPTYKKGIKRMAPALAKNVLDAVAYEVSDDLIDALRPFIQKGNERQLANAFWNARVPHDNMWLCFNLRKYFDECKTGYFLSLELDGKEYPTGAMYLGVHIEKQDSNLLATNSKTKFPQFFHQYKFYTANKFPNESRPFIRHMPFTVITNAYTDEYNTEINVTDHKETNDLLRSMGLRMLLGKCGMNKLQHEPTTPDLKNLSKNLSVVPNSISSPSIITMVDMVKNDTSDYLENITGALAPVIALISALNYDWVTKDPEPRPQGVRNITSRMQPRNSHFKVGISLPKEKAGRLIGKQPLRTRLFGNREHEVRGHWRVLRDEGGFERKRTWIAAHHRGDSKLGVVTKEYVLKKAQGAK